MAAPCKWCGSKEHAQFYCRQKPRTTIPKISKKRLANPVPRKVSKPLSKVGKKDKQWQVTSREWKKQNPPNDQGLWYCRIGGGQLSDKVDVSGYRLNLCHDFSRARRPDLANELDNIFPGCGKHNKDQGSRSLDEYLLSEPNLRCGDY